MRFCPFCGADNQDEASHCVTCARRMPPLPNRRQRAAEMRAATPSSGGRVSQVVERATPPPPSPAVEATVAEEEEWPAPLPPADVIDPDDWTNDVHRKDRTPLRTDHTPLPAPIEPRLEASEPAAARPVAPGEPEPAPVMESTRPVAADFKSPEVIPVPEIPEPGLWSAVKYTLAFGRARFQRRQAIKLLRVQIRSDTTSLDGVLGALGRHVRSLGVESPAIESENQAISEAETRLKKAEYECAQIDNRQAEENSRFGDVEADRQAKLNEAAQSLERAQKDMATIEAQRKTLRDKKRDLERLRKTHLKGATDKEQSASKTDNTEAQVNLRRAAEVMRKDAESLTPDLTEVDRQLAALERPAAQASSRLDALRGELEACRRGLNDAKEGHRHRLSELDGERSRRSREHAQAEAEIQRRLVTLGTLVNLNRIKRPEFDELYRSIDELRGVIGSRASEIDRLSAEREAFDRASLIRGVATLGGGVLAGMLLVALLIAIF